MSDKSTFSAIIYSLLGDLGDQVWIGLSDIQQEGYFVYIDGEPATSGNTGWYSGEPNNKDNEDCGSLYSTGDDQNNTANDEDCERDLLALCESPVLC